MSLIHAENLGVSFGDFDLFNGISLSIANDAKTGLIGVNGVGKTTLLLILAGINRPTTGSVHLAKGRRIGYLRQESMDAFANRTHTVYQEMLTVFEHLLLQQSCLHDLEAAMASGGFDDGLMETYGSLQREFELAGGYEIDLRIQQTLQGLGLGDVTWQMPLDHLSGGQRTRALLARLLLEKPDLLILDEPTNHLDIDAVEWLEQTLRAWDGAVLIVSHDRYFLDNTVNEIWEMHPYGIETFSGNYSGYLLQRQERWEYYERVFKEEKAKLLNEVDFIQRNWVRASTHARAMGMLRKVSRKLAMVEQYGIMSLRNGMKWHDTGLRADKPLDVIEAVRMTNAIKMEGSRPPRMRPDLHTQHHGGTIVISIDELVVGYPGNVLFTAQDVELRRGECAALIGPNGAGKTTFLRMLLDELQPLAGEARLGAGLQVGYLAQAQDALDDANTVLEEFIFHKPMDPGSARSYLARYLFRGEDVLKLVAALSGGERARLGLAIMATEGANFLILDEPTNHLDISAQEALQEVLEDFRGTILLVSHDRYLIDRLATQVWEIKESGLHVHQGNYRDYVLRAAASSSATRSRESLLMKTPVIRGDDHKTRKRLENMSMLEERIRQQEKMIQALSRDLQSAGQLDDYVRVQAISWDIASAQNHLEDLMGEWEQIAS